MRLSLLVAIGLGIIGVLILLGYQHDWTGFGPRTVADGTVLPPRLLWDWLALLIVPAAIAGGIFMLNDSRKRADQRLELDRQRQDVLNQYVDQITQLLLKKSLKDSPGPEVQSIARTRTLSALRLLDGSRKAQLLQFIYETGLIGDPPVIDLLGADLTGARLDAATLRNSHLRGVYFVGASFQNANFAGADLRGSDLTEVDARQCDFTNADLAQACMRAACMDAAETDGANFDQVDFREAKPKALIERLLAQGKE